jgi:predicted NAD/FAD-dependent oxidoreductase
MFESKYSTLSLQVSPGVYLCGDHRGTATLNGAIESGKMAARDLLRNI